MLTINKRKTHLHETVITGLVIVVLVLAIVMMLSILDSMWNRDICGRVPLTDYQTKSAPAKCQILYEEGRLW